MSGSDPVSAAVAHFVDHWRKRSFTEKSLMEPVHKLLKRYGYEGGISPKALSAWKNGRQRPELLALIALRDVAGCGCLDRISGFPLYSDRNLSDLLATTRTAGAELTAAERAVLDRVVALSAAAASDCDVVADGFRLRDVYVRRDVEMTLAGHIRPRSLTALRGEAGYGKTALMWHLHQRLTGTDRLALLIPATALLRGARGERDAGAVTVDDLWIALRAAVRGDGTRCCWSTPSTFSRTVRRPGSRCGG